LAPNSPDPNPLDYAVWGALLQRVYHRQKFNKVEELKRRSSSGKNHRFINSSINEWRRRLECVVKNGGGHNTAISLELKLD